MDHIRTDTKIDFTGDQANNSMAEIYRQRYRAELEGGVYLGFHIVVQLEGGIQLYSVMVGTRKSLINIYIHMTITTTTENHYRKWINVGVTKRLERMYLGWVDKHRERDRGMNVQMDGILFVPRNPVSCDDNGHKRG